MDIFNSLSDKDCEALLTYLNWYGGRDEGGDSGHMAAGDLPYFLRYWNTNKATLFKMFGEKTIVKQAIAFERDRVDMDEEMYYTIDRDKGAMAFILAYINKIMNLGFEWDMESKLRGFVYDSHALVENIFPGEGFCIPGTATVDGKPLQINKGCKMVKMLGKIAKVLGVDTVGYKCKECGRVHRGVVSSCHSCASTEIEKIDTFECFRQAHSRALNCKTIKGNLCLSIHPLDYVTMSDNTFNWDSCMNWMGCCGDFRLGTIECMNSPYIVVAYVESENEKLVFGHHEWNSKRWRELMVVTPELILANRQYPYDHDFLRGSAMKMLRQLVETNPAYGPYDNESYQIENHSSANTIGNMRIAVDLDFNYMYNDIYDRRLSYIAPSKIKGNRISYNLSGPAVCTTCGDIIPSGDEADPRSTVCRSCAGEWQCSCCGDWQDGEAYEVDGRDVCYHCYHYEMRTCEVCGETHYNDNMNKIYIQLTELPEGHPLECENWSYVIDACDDCMGSKKFEEMFGPVFYRHDMWCRRRPCVLLNNFSEEGVYSGSLSGRIQEVFNEIRTAGSDKAEISLVEKYFS